VDFNPGARITHGSILKHFLSAATYLPVKIKNIQKNSFSCYYFIIAIKNIPMKNRPYRKCNSSKKGHMQSKFLITSTLWSFHATKVVLFC